MATFSAYQYHPFLLDSVFLPNTPFNDHQVFENQTPPNLVTNTSTFGSDQFHDPFPDFNNSQKQCNDLLIHDQSSTVVDTNHLENSDHQVTQDTNLPIANYNDKKRMFKNDSTVSSLNSSDHSKIDAAHGKSKRGRKNSSKTETEEKKDKKRSPDSQEPPTGYIHVRARRGQATDSHSLAERVRREKISERMKILQSLVPGCDKVTGKALMLDEIINYVQSLQNQVEFLSMKLASLSPILYDFGMDLDHALMMRSTERVNSNSIASLLPPSVLQASVQQCSSSRSPTTQTTTAFGVDHQPNPTNNTITTTTNFISPNNFPILVTNNNNNSPSFLVHGHKPNTNNLAQGSHGAMWDMGEQRQKFLNQSIVGTNLCSFQQI